MTPPSRFLLLTLVTLVFCSCGDDPAPPQVSLPTPVPTPTPPPVPAPVFLQDKRYTLVLSVQCDPHKATDEAEGVFIDTVRKASGEWGNSFTATYYVVDSAVRRDIDNESKIFVSLYRPDAKLFWTWKTGSLVKDVEGSVTQLPYTGADPKDDEMNLDFKGRWTRQGNDINVSGRKCSVLRLTQANGGAMEFVLDATTGALVHFQALDGCVVCTVSDYKLGIPNPALFKPPEGAFIDKPEVTPSPSP